MIAAPGSTRRFELYSVVNVMAGSIWQEASHYGEHDVLHEAVGRIHSQSPRSTPRCRLDQVVSRNNDDRSEETSIRSRRYSRQWHLGVTVGRTWSPAGWRHTQLDDVETGVAGRVSSRTSYAFCIRCTTTAKC